MKRAELLAPSGNYECVKAAVSNGADAVYLGGQLFNARAYAANFDNEELEKVCDYCHGYGVKVYVTVNTLYKDEEYPELLKFIDELYVMGVDGLIMQDMGAITMVRKYWPDFPVHVSTQLTTNSLQDIRFYEEMGATTAVLSRELSLEEIREICENTSMRIETFIHGALCVSYSGQCLMSSMLGNRSGNRGKCTQNCRLPYQLYQENKKIAEGRLLSTKDICTLDLLPELLETGVASLKIEGRMKSPEYVAGVTAIYRKYLDMYYETKGKYQVDEADRDILKQLFNRGGFSAGYLKTHSGVSMMCRQHPKSWGVLIGRVLNYDNRKLLATIRLERNLYPGDGIEIWSNDEEGTGCYINKEYSAGTDITLKIKGRIAPKQAVYQTFNKKLNDYLDTTFAATRRRRKVEGTIRLYKNHEASLVLKCGQISVSVSGDVIEESVRQPLTDELVTSQISRMGNTIFELDKLEVERDDDVYLNKSSLNYLKNEACRLLQERIAASFKRKSREYECEKAASEGCQERKLTIRVRNNEQFRCACSLNNVDTVYYDLCDELMSSLEENIGLAHENGVKLVVKLPRIFRKYVEQRCQKDIDRLNESDIDGYLIHNVGQYRYLQNSGKKLMLDFTGNVLNSCSYDFWADRTDRVCMSIESSREEINEINGRGKKEVLAYGLLPLMVTNQCPIGNFAGGKVDKIHCSRYNHKDSYYMVNGSNRFRLITDCEDCICHIMSNEPLNTVSRIADFDADYIRLDFMDEPPEQIKKITESYLEALEGKRFDVRQNYGVYEHSVL